MEVWWKEKVEGRGAHSQTHVDVSELVFVCGSDLFSKYNRCLEFTFPPCERQPRWDGNRTRHRGFHLREACFGGLPHSRILRAPIR